MDKVEKKNWYIHSPQTDIPFIILCPVIALVVVFLICAPRAENYVYSDLTPIWFAIAASILTHAHVLLVFARSHLNMSVFKRYKYRFTLIPILALAILWSSVELYIVVGALALYWDEWHSLMQTFGFGRIYDGKLGNDPLVGRKLDMGMAFVVGLLPNIILLTYLPNSQADGAFVEHLEMPLQVVKLYSKYILGARVPLIIFGLGYILFYIAYYYRLIKSGYQYSKAKFALFAVTGMTTLVITKFYTIADGIFFGNIYHALQYIFIVYVSEKNNLGVLAVKKANESSDKNKINKMGAFIYFLLIIPMVFVFAGVRQSTQGFRYIGAFWLLTSLLHFWFDGFIWSVRRQDVR